MANSNPITADMRPTLDLNKFRFWCQKVLPLVYDDSLSYYEVLCKVVDYLNKAMEDVGERLVRDNNTHHLIIAMPLCNESEQKLAERIR